MRRAPNEVFSLCHASHCVLVVQNTSRSLTLMCTFRNAIGRSASVTWWAPRVHRRVWAVRTLWCRCGDLGTRAAMVTAEPRTGRVRHHVPARPGAAAAKRWDVRRTPAHGKVKEIATFFSAVGPPNLWTILTPGFLAASRAAAHAVATRPSASPEASAGRRRPGSQGRSQRAP